MNLGQQANTSCPPPPGEVRCGVAAESHILHLACLGDTGSVFYPFHSLFFLKDLFRPS